jgi:dihydroneopterin aldolase
MVAELDAVLSVENIRVKAQHGWYQEERKLGGMYSVSVKMFHRVKTSEQFHNLDSSINYELIYSKVLEVMEREFHLIEECCKYMHEALKKLDQESIWEVELVKEQPPLKFVGLTKFALKG